MTMPRLPWYVKWLLVPLFCWPTMLFSQPTQVSVLFEAAKKLGGYEEVCQARGGCPIPAVVVQQVAEENIAGQFTWFQPTVVTMSYAYTPGSLEWNSVLVHEFVHYLQWLTGKIGPNTPCEGIAQAEVEAYDVAAKYLQVFGIHEDFASQRFWLSVMCQPG